MVLDVIELLQGLRTSRQLRWKILVAILKSDLGEGNGGQEGDSPWVSRVWTKGFVMLKGREVSLSLFDDRRALETRMCLCLWLLGQSLIYTAAKKELLSRYQSTWSTQQERILLESSITQELDNPIGPQWKDMIW